MAPSSIKSLLNQKSAECLPHDQLIDKIFHNLMGVMRDTDLFSAEFFIPDMLQGSAKAKADLWRSSMRDTLKDIFPDDGDGQMARMAFEMNKAALDYCCGLIVENFLKHEDVNADIIVEVVSDVIAEKHKGLLSERQTKKVLQNVRDSFPAYKALNNLAAAGEVFGFPVDDTLSAEMAQHRTRIINGAIEDATSGFDGPEMA